MAKEYIHKNHYSHGSHNGASPCYGLFEKSEKFLGGEKLIGALMFATPCSEAVRSSIFGKEHKDKVIELHRLHILDVTPKNTESWFIARCIRLLKKDNPKIKAIISFSDTTENHSGIIYQASNFMYCGKTSKARFYRDENGRLRHPRQCGKNIKLEEAKRLGWKSEYREAKNRYVLLVYNDRNEKKKLLKMFKLKILSNSSPPVRTQSQSDCPKED